MKIYVVTEGSYSAYHIICATLDKEQAERAVKFFSDEYDTAEIEEYDSDEIKLIPDGSIEWGVHISSIDHSVIDIETFNKPRLNNYIYYNTAKNLYSIYINACDEAHAIKVATDELAKYLAEKEGL